MTEGDPAVESGDGTAVSPFPAAYGSVGGGPNAATPEPARRSRRAAAERRADRRADTPADTRGTWGSPPAPAVPAGPVVPAAASGEGSTVAAPAYTQTAVAPPRPAPGRRSAPPERGDRGRGEPGRTPADRPAYDRSSADRTSADRTSADRSSADRFSPDRTGLDRTGPERGDPDGPGADDASGRAASDLIARRIVESEMPDAAYELGKPHRFRRRKVTVIRTRSDRRLLRRIDTWTVFKMSLMFYLLMLVVVMVAGVVTWYVAQRTGFVADIQKSVRSLADDRKFVLKGSAAFKYTLLGGAVLAVVATILNVVASMLYNLLSDIFGGVQVIVLSEPD